MNIRQARKMLRLATFLRTRIPRLGWRGYFNMDSWASKISFVEKKCGTTACAMGWATVAFPRSGLMLQTLEGNPSRVWIYYVPRGSKATRYKSRYEGLSAAEAFFGISYADARHLFMPLSYGGGAVTPTAVAQRLEEFVALRPHTRFVGK